MNSIKPKHQTFQIVPAKFDGNERINFRASHVINDVLKTRGFPSVSAANRYLRNRFGLKRRDYSFKF